MHYATTRYSPDPRREVVWRVLAPHLWSRFDLGASIVDVGCGYGDFIRNVPAARRVAVDREVGFASGLPAGVTFVRSDAHTFFDAVDARAPGERYSAVFSSNLLEHLSRPEIASFFGQARRALQPGGKLVLLLPNYARAAASYFDDYTHVTPLSHAGVGDWLASEGFTVVYSHPGYMPLSVKDSRLPVTEALVRAWLRSPVKPGGKQMLFVAVPHET